MKSANDINIRKVNRTRRITLTRPDALNAMTYKMCLAIEAAIDDWSQTDEINLIVIDGEGERAFCAGGDVVDLYQAGLNGDFAYGRKFWADEYRLNARIANCAIPYVALMDGYTMGGGVGISAHGSDRIVTERSLISMPECAIGLIPDVGGSRILSRAPGRLGEFLAMTGYRMGSGDAVLAGFGDVQVKSEQLGDLIRELEETGDISGIAKYGQPPASPELAEHLDRINYHFAQENAVDCLASLKSDDSLWAANTIAQIRIGCPLAVACTFEIVRQARALKTIEEVLALEYRFSWRALSEGEMLEGIRALIIDKDRKPDWQSKRLEEVSMKQVADMLAPLKPEHELRFTADSN